MLVMLVAADILFTYYLLYRVKRSGRRNWYDLEGNAIIRGLLKRFGLHKGIRLGALFSIAMMTGILVYFSKRLAYLGFVNVVYLIMGFYFAILMSHMSSLAYITKHGGSSNESKQDKAPEDKGFFARGNKKIQSLRQGKGN